MQKLRITYNETCELLSIKRDALRLLIQQDSTFPRPIKFGAHRQSPVFFDYSEIVAWHNAQKEKSVKA